MEYNHLPPFLYKSKATVQNGEFVSNQAEYGGTVLAYNSGVVFTGQNVSYINNTSEKGGVIYAKQ